KPIEISDEDMKQEISGEEKETTETDEVKKEKIEEESKLDNIPVKHEELSIDLKEDENAESQAEEIVEKIVNEIIEPNIESKEGLNNLQLSKQMLKQLNKNILFNEDFLKDILPDYSNINKTLKELVTVLEKERTDLKNVNYFKKEIQNNFAYRNGLYFSETSVKEYNNNVDSEKYAIINLPEDTMVFVITANKLFFQDLIYSTNKYTAIKNKFTYMMNHIIFNLKNKFYFKDYTYQYLYKEDSFANDPLNKKLNMELLGSLANVTQTIYIDEIKEKKVTMHKLYGGWFHYLGIMVIHGYVYKPIIKDPAEINKNLVIPLSEVEEFKKKITQKKHNAYYNDYTLGLWRDYPNNKFIPWRFSLELFLWDIIDVMPHELPHPSDLIIKYRRGYEALMNNEGENVSIGGSIVGEKQNYIESNTISFNKYEINNWYETLKKKITSYPGFEVTIVSVQDYLEKSLGNDATKNIKINSNKTSKTKDYILLILLNKNFFVKEILESSKYHEAKIGYFTSKMNDILKTLNKLLEEISKLLNNDNSTPIDVTDSEDVVGGVVGDIVGDVVGGVVGDVVGNVVGDVVGANSVISSVQSIISSDSNINSTDETSDKIDHGNNNSDNEYKKPFATFYNYLINKNNYENINPHIVSELAGITKHIKCNNSTVDNFKCTHDVSLHYKYGGWFEYGGAIYIENVIPVYNLTYEKHGTIINKEYENSILYEANGKSRNIGLWRDLPNKNMSLYRYPLDVFALEFNHYSIMNINTLHPYVLMDILNKGIRLYRPYIVHINNTNIGTGMKNGVNDNLQNKRPNEIETKYNLFNSPNRFVYPIRELHNIRKKNIEKYNVGGIGTNNTTTTISAQTNTVHSDEDNYTELLKGDTTIHNNNIEQLERVKKGIRTTDLIKKTIYGIKDLTKIGLINEDSEDRNQYISENVDVGDNSEDENSEYANDDSIKIYDENKYIDKNIGSSNIHNKTIISKEEQKTNMTESDKKNKSSSYFLFSTLGLDSKDYDNIERNKNNNIGIGNKNQSNIDNNNIDNTTKEINDDL
ncbi:conserved protein, unknown function, partial [Hepatocystis sp. ex Piliocolobus tephrosceles]